ncbi:peptide chain release factor N(5)-glutamine methyltransferase [Neptuniibacter sp. 2_MG-2023]|jgi:release factor glutamine methyltransferase|uniref:peptide chain release factor N(5)-glutamine methyltransferase n=1 Tax=Neptuniibacter sp. 2_MG-2023 TaxID=3062671 RepID=UPI0026E378BB|nr:peptide chain release factor N(5)-glutamine methyltransferase [Neptuniibacter sp. 2_MG-2023]MDO6514503.1 peptide chain release factor N(5)-glutamine methyltransferase [Neptuniibacter sp. 2_MG-2023]
MQIQQALALYSQLEDKSESAALDIELMLCSLLGKPRSYLFTWPEKELPQTITAQLEVMIQRRCDGEPVAHILGARGFWDFDLEVSPHTLIPRPDTEILVEQVLALDLPSSARVADLGTGTGAIALALAWERPEWAIVASDYVAEAVALAERNRDKLKLHNVSLLQGSWFEPHSGEYDLIVSNPPYIDPNDPHLLQGDVRFEPLSALIADKKGMADIELISDQARDFLCDGGFLLFEHGYDQGENCRALLNGLGYEKVETLRDYGNNERVTLGQWIKC